MLPAMLLAGTCPAPEAGPLRGDSLPAAASALPVEPAGQHREFPHTGLLGTAVSHSGHQLLYLQSLQPAAPLRIVSRTEGTLPKEAGRELRGRGFLVLPC